MRFLVVFAFTPNVFPNRNGRKKDPLHAAYMAAQR
jgi:hypothetical protein